VSESARRSGRRASQDWDQGEATERTLLAWQRTAIGTFAVAALVLRTGIATGPLWLAIVISTLLVLTAAVEWLLSRSSYAAIRDAPRAPTMVLHERAISVVASVTVLAALGSIWLSYSR
jgi:uncharacterized membrane protein YidH (DUF202 family)